MAYSAAFSMVFFCAVWQGCFSFESTKLSVEELAVRLENLESRQKVCEQEVNKLQQIIQKNTVHKRAVWDLHVAFSTLLTRNQDHVGIGQTIKFDRVLLNEGSGYSVNSGTFTVPVAGVYLFSYFVAHGYDAGQVWVELMKNGIKVNAGVADPYHNYQDIQGGNIAIIRAETGDEIWVEAFHQNDAFLYGADGFTSFSGFLLY